MIDPNLHCIHCKRLISIPPFGLGECSIGEGPHKDPHPQKEHCIEWQPLRREIAYCAPLQKTSGPPCKMNGRTITERGRDVYPAPESRPLKEWPIGSALKEEFDVSDAIPGAPIYFVVGYGDVVKLDPKTRARTACELPAFVKMCPAGI